MEVFIMLRKTEEIYQVYIEMAQVLEGLSTSRLEQQRNRMTALYRRTVTYAYTAFIPILDRESICALSVGLLEVFRAMERILAHEQEGHWADMAKAVTACMQSLGDRPEALKKQNRILIQELQAYELTMLSAATSVTGTGVLSRLHKEQLVDALYKLSHSIDLVYVMMD